LNRLLVITHVLGGLLVVFSGTFLMPLGWSLAVDDGAHRSFLVSALACLGAGGLAWTLTRPYRRELEPRDGPLLVVLGWLVMAIAAAVPLKLEIEGLSFTLAFFEAVAGLTTTGATALTGIEGLPQSVNIWRHAMQWYGGMGIIVMAIAILPMIGVGGMQMFKAEMAGPMKEAKLTPRITETAKYLWLIYIVLTLLCLLSLRFIGGQSWFDSVCHAFSALALGGFSNRDSSIADFDSPMVEAILVVFMLIAVLNFATHFRALRARSAVPYLRDPEARAVLGLLLGSALGLGIYLYLTGVYDSLPAALRHALFNTVSVGTSTGYMSQDYALWPAFAPIWLLLLACFGSSAGSTGGGIKMIRSLILLRQTVRELARIVHPRAIAPLTINGQIIETKIIFAVLGFMLLWGLTQLVVTFLLLASGLDFVTAFSAAIATVNNLGPALGEFGPSSNYSGMNDFQTWLLSFAMLAGRLELLTFFVVLTPAFWRR
jgi:trk system potassium uptake protein